MSDTSQSNLVYGWFINDYNHLFDIPRTLTNDAGTEKCLYVGKVTEGKYGTRNWQNRINEHTTSSKNSNDPGYHTPKYVSLRLCEAEGVVVEHRKLADLTGGEEFDQYIKYAVAGHPTMNEKYGDRITNFKDEVMKLIDAGDIKTEDDFNKEVKQLEYNYKLMTDKEYATKEQNRKVRLQKDIIKDYIELAFTNAHDCNVVLGPMVTMRFDLIGISMIVNPDILNGMKEGGKLNALVRDSTQVHDMIDTIQFWGNVNIERDARSTDNSMRCKIINMIVDEFETDAGYNVERFMHSIGKINFRRMK